jgi:hypothetical protein
MVGFSPYRTYTAQVAALVDYWHGDPFDFVKTINNFDNKHKTCLCNMTQGGGK